MNLGQLFENLRNTGALSNLVRDNAAQFGIPARQYLGATILPELPVESNMYEELAVRFRTIVSVDMDWYSPPVLRKGELTSAMNVKLGTSGIKREMDAQMYDTLVNLIGRNQGMDALATAIRWFDTVINRSMLESAERQRWEAIVDASVVRVGDNGYSETVNYANPSGHRAAAAAAWSTDATDIFDNIHAMAQVLKDKGYSVGRIITSSNVVAIMAANDTVKSRGGVAVINASGQITSAAGRATLDSINNILSQDKLPPIETYDLQYRTQTTTKRFLKDDVMVLLATSDRDPRIDLGDSEDLFNFGSVVGYHAIGKVAGASDPGRHAMAEYVEKYPPHIEGEGVQMHLPVILEPEALAVITGIS